MEVRVSPTTFEFSLLTPPGRGAVATIEVRGNWCAQEFDAGFPFAAATVGRKLSMQPVGRLWYGAWGGEQVVIGRVASDCWEVHCHGGAAAVGAICADLSRLGGVPRERSGAGERNACGLAAEVLEAVRHAATWRVAERLLRSPVAEWLAILSRWSAELSGSTVDSFDYEKARQAVKDWRTRASFGRHLTEPWNVLLVGEPNVGKSSLLNRLAGYERAIVHHEPGTTRDLVAVTTAIDGWPVRLIDSAGIRPGADPLESLGIARALDISRDADLILHLSDASLPPTAAEEELRRRWPDALRVAHKCDLPIAEARRDEHEAMRVSSQTGEGIASLPAAIAARLIPEVPAADAISPINLRQERMLGALATVLDAEDATGVSRVLRELREGC